MSIKAEAFSLMKDWCDHILEFTVNNPSPYIDGSVLCPACTVVHGRIADLVFPLTLLYKETGDEKYLISAKRMVEWADINVYSEDGLTVNDRGNLWKGTSAFYAMALGETLHRMGDILDPETKARWEGIFLRISNAAVDYFSSSVFSPHINYYAGAAALFALAFRYTGDNKYLRKALIHERYCREHFDSEGLLYGEGKPRDRVTEKGVRCIDIGYNIEESIPLLIIASHYLGQSDMLDFYTKRAIDHLEFMLPDGGIDNSFGTRHNKWTYWGSRTSDGLCEGFVLVAGKDKRIARAILENFRLLRRCTFGKALFAGLMARSAGEVACLHHAFTHAKALAAFYLDIKEEDYLDLEGVKLPREESGIKSFQGGNLLTVTKGDFTATVNACDFVLFPDAENGGGSPSLLWNKKYGCVLASTTYIFTPTEPLNMQFQRGGIAPECMTARFEDNRGYRSVKENTFVISEENGVITAESKQIPLSFQYTVSEDSVEIRVRSARDGVYILPIVSETGDKVDVTDKAVIFRDILKVDSSAAVKAEYRRDKVPFYHMVGGFEYIKLSYKVKANEELTVRITV